MSGKRDIDGEPQSGLVSTKELAKLLAYPSAAAVRQAITRGYFPIKVMKLPHRKGYFAWRETVEEHLNKLKENSMDSG